MRYAPNEKRTRGAIERRPAVKKNSTTREPLRGKVRMRGKLTIGMDLGDRSSRYCILDEQGEAMLDRSIATTRKGMDQAFGSIARCRIALEVGTHSPWVSRPLAKLGHEVIVANARRVRLISESSRTRSFLDPFLPQQPYLDHLGKAHIAEQCQQQDRPVQSRQACKPKRRRQWRIRQPHSQGHYG
jgi:hypothetical protein